MHFDQPIIDGYLALGQVDDNTPASVATYGQLYIKETGGNLFYLGPNGSPAETNLLGFVPYTGASSAVSLGNNTLTITLTSGNSTAITTTGYGTGYGGSFTGGGNGKGIYATAGGGNNIGVQGVGTGNQPGGYFNSTGTGNGSVGTDPSGNASGILGHYKDSSNADGVYGQGYGTGAGGYFTGGNAGTGITVASGGSSYAGVSVTTGGIVAGTPTSGNMGTGTVNATGLYVNGTAVGTGTVTGSSSANYLAFWNGTSSLSGSSNLQWNTGTNNILSVAQSGVSLSANSTLLSVNYSGSNSLSTYALRGAQIQAAANSTGSGSSLIGLDVQTNANNAAGTIAYLYGANVSVSSNTTGGTSNYQYGLYISSGVTNATVNNLYGMFVNSPIAGTVGTFIGASYGNPTFNSSYSPSGNMSGIIGTFTSYNGTSTGINFTVASTGTGNVQGLNLTAQTSGTSNQLEGLHVYCSAAGASTTNYGVNVYPATVGTNYGVYVQPTAVTGTPTNLYGLYVGALSGATNNYAIYTGGGNIVASAGQIASTPAAGASQTPSGTTVTINWNTGNLQTINLSSASGNVAVTLSNGVTGASYCIKVIQGANSRNLTWTGVKWVGGTVPTITTTNGAVDVLSFIYDGANYYGGYLQALS